MAFLPPNGSGAGVRLKRPEKGDARSALERTASSSSGEMEGGGPGVRLRETQQAAPTIPIEELNAENDE